MKFSDEQILASKHFLGPALVLAVPGAGKTTLILKRCKNLIDRGVDKKSILSISFSKAAALNMQERFKRDYPAYAPIKFATIHSFCFGIIMHYCRLRSKTLKFIDADGSPGSLLSLKKIMEKMGLAPLTEEKLTVLLTEISYVKNMCMDAKEFASDRACQTPLFYEIFKEYETFKEKMGLFDFDDMITLAYKILKEDAYLLRSILDNFEFIQLDEGQDTSISQFKLIRLIASRKKNLFIVADDDQNIYSFRGARSDNLKDLELIYPDLKIYKLSTNYRSSDNIVRLAGSFISQNKTRYEKDFLAKKESQEPIKILKFTSAQIFEKYLLDDLKEEESTAILYRNNVSSLSICEILERNNIDFTIRDRGMSFYNNPLVFDIKDILNFAKNRGDFAAFSRIYFKIKTYITGPMLAYLAGVKSSNLLEDLRDFPSLKPFYIKRFRDLSSMLDTLMYLNPRHALSYILKDLSYEDYLKNENFRYLKQTGSTYEFLDILKNVAKNSKTLTDFFGRLKYLDSVLKESQYKKSRISLSTIHGAKGLEFDKVIVVDLYENNLPSRSSLDFLSLGNAEPFEEERRLLYVAMTRARYKLRLCYIEYENTKMSRFLTELKGL